MIYYLSFLFLCLFSSLFSLNDILPSIKPPYIIGLMQVKDEEPVIEYALSALALYTDAIIVLDDGSEDKTVATIQKLKLKLNILTIITNKRSEWIYGSEVTNRQKLLDTGRQYGGTHFIELDADEILTTHCLEDNWLRNKLLSLKKGQILQLPLINLWKSFNKYRSKFTNLYPNISYCTIAYCDDGVSNLSHNLKYSDSTFLHFGRFPHKIPTAGYPLFIYESDLNRSIIHLSFVNWEHAIIKKVWIIMLEIIRLQEKIYNHEKFPKERTLADINSFYEIFHNYDDKNIELTNVPNSWLKYSFFKKEPYLNNYPTTKLKQICQWIKTYGEKYFHVSNYISAHLKDLLKKSDKEKLL